MRVAVRSLCFSRDCLLVQRHGDVHAFIGGGMEDGDRLEDRLRTEYAEEFGVDVDVVRFLFVVENRFVLNDRLRHQLETYFLVRIRAGEPRQREPHIVPVWLPLAAIPSAELRPFVVRDAVASGAWSDIRHMVVG